MTISRDAEGGIELDHCIIEGTLYIKGGETVVLTNTRVGSIVVRDGYGRETVLIADGLTAKLIRTPEEVRTKFRGCLSRVVNEGANGVICLIL